AKDLKSQVEEARNASGWRKFCSAPSLHLVNISAQVLIRVSSCVPAALCAASSIRYRQYHFIYDPKNWTEAQTYCRQTLADVTQMGSTKHSNSGVPQAWIGLYFDVIDWKWSLSDEDFYKNNEATYTNWYPGQPDSIWYTEYCGNIYVDQGRWWDTPCDNLLSSICSNVSGENK
uniref:C-type lectin domain-containing protein n=1 Tax=Nothobranchius furzeri TaxID=105023 RepID=A0A8C6LY66_NOTFU